MIRDYFQYLTQKKGVSFPKIDNIDSVSDKFDEFRKRFTHALRKRRCLEQGNGPGNIGVNDNMTNKLLNFYFNFNQVLLVKVDFGPFLTLVLS